MNRDTVLRSAAQFVEKIQAHEYDPLLDYEVLGHLGSGAYGQIFRACDRKSGTPVALKAIPLDESDISHSAGAEVVILRRTLHPNVVLYYNSFVYESRLWIAMEFCEAGSVLDMMRRLRRPLSEDEIAFLAVQVLDGLAYLHSKKIVHRDIKAANVLVTASGACKLGDFGCSASNLSLHTSRNHSVIGSPYWMAPEVIVGSAGGGYTEKADVWSFGITLIELAERKPPRHNIHPVRVLFVISKSDPPSFSDALRWSAPFRDFVSCCLQKEDHKRWSPSELLRHEFLRLYARRKPSFADGQTPISMMPSLLPALKPDSPGSDVTVEAEDDDGAGDERSASRLSKLLDEEGGAAATSSEMLEEPGFATSTASARLVTASERTFSKETMRRAVQMQTLKPCKEDMQLKLTEEYLESAAGGQDMRGFRGLLPWASVTAVFSPMSFPGPAGFQMGLAAWSTTRSPVDSERQVSALQKHRVGAGDERDLFTEAKNLLAVHSWLVLLERRDELLRRRAKGRAAGSSSMVGVIAPAASAAARSSVDNASSIECLERALAGVFGE